MPEAGELRAGCEHTDCTGLEDESLARQIFERGLTDLEPADTLQRIRRYPVWIGYQEDRLPAPAGERQCVDTCAEYLAVRISDEITGSVTAITITGGSGDHGIIVENHSAICAGLPLIAIALLRRQSRLRGRGTEIPACFQGYISERNQGSRRYER